MELIQMGAAIVCNSSSRRGASGPAVSGNRTVTSSGLVVILLAASIGVVFVLRSPRLWIVGVPLVIVLGLIWLSFLSGRFGKCRQVTPEGLADELEGHLLGTEGKWDWDDVTSLKIADKRLEQLRARLHKFDSLPSREREEEFRQIIAALRGGKIPDIHLDASRRLAASGGTEPDLEDIKRVRADEGGE